MKSLDGNLLVLTGVDDTRLAYTIPGWCEASGCGRTQTYAAIAAGKLRARKFGKRTLILVPDGRAFLASLPELNSGEAA